MQVWHRAKDHSTKEGSNRPSGNRGKDLVVYVDGRTMGDDWLKVKAIAHIPFGSGELISYYL